MSQEQTSSIFDQVVPRRGTNCAKWDTFDQVIGIEDLIHVGCADTDFKVPEAITQRFKELIEHGIYGYSEIFADFFEAIQHYYEKHHGVKVEKEHIVFCPRINIACGLCAEAFTRPYENVLIHTPSYSPLRQAIIENGREIIEVSLDFDKQQHTYSLTKEALEKAVNDKTRMLILVNPHNPTTRVFSEQELLLVCEFCKEHDLVMFVDEIHADLCRDDIKFTSILHMPKQYHEHIMLASSPAKSFNIPGLVGSFMIIPNPKLRERFKGELSRVGEHNPNVFFNAALSTAYTQCDDYLIKLRPYIDANESYITQAFNSLFPHCHVTPREGSYLLWIDMRECFESEESLRSFFFEKARVGVYLGGQFGKGYERFIRFNLGAPRATLEQVVARIGNAKAGRSYNA